MVKMHTYKNWKKGTIGKCWLYDHQDLKGHFEKFGKAWWFVPDWEKNTPDEQSRMFMGCMFDWSPRKKDRKNPRVNRQQKRQEKAKKAGKVSKPQAVKKHKHRDR